MIIPTERRKLPPAEQTISTLYGRSPSIDCLPALHEFNNLPADQRLNVSSELVVAGLFDEDED